MSAVWRVQSGGIAPVSSVEELEQLLLRQRGVIGEDRQRFFDVVYERDVHDPFTLYQMEIAVERLRYAIKHGERIVVYGDYDADGISGTAILITALRSLGAVAMPFLPHRLDHGYGLNREVLRSLAPEFDVLVTVDCGVANAEEINWVTSQGKDVIVVDHHEIPEELPAARAILHPRHPQGSYPFGHLCGAGMAWKLSTALLRDTKTPQRQSMVEVSLLDLAVLGTIADVMPLLGENRAIVHFGLKMLRRTQRPGLRALLEEGRLLGALTAQDLSFRVIPKINAAGRMDHAQPALDALLAQTPQQAATAVAQLLAYNQQRQQVTLKIMTEAAKQIDASAPVIFAASAAWPPGVVGLAASKLAQKYERPAVVIGGNGDILVGSARCPKGYNMLQVLNAGREHLTKMGGHAQAAGFSLPEENLPSFRQAILAADAGSFVAADTTAPVADAVLPPHLLHWDTFSMLEKFEPFGAANPRPLVVVKRLPILEARSVGKTGTHARFRFQTGDGSLTGIGFGLAERLPHVGKHAAVMGRLQVNEFRGHVDLQFTIEHIEPSHGLTLKEEAPVVG